MEKNGRLFPQTDTGSYSNINILILIILVAAIGGIISGLTQGYLVLGLLIFFYLLITLVWKPLFGMCLLLLIRPSLEAVRNWQIPYIADYGVLNPAGILTIAFIFVAAFYLVTNSAFLVPRRLIITYCIFIVIAGVSITVSISKINAVGEFIRYISYLFIFLVVRNVIKTTRHIISILNIIVISAIPPVLYGLLQIVYGPTKVVLGIPQVTSFFAHQNNLAIFLTIVIPINLILFFVTGKRNLKFVYLVTILIFSFVLLKTYSRAAWIGFLFSVFFILWFVNKKYILIVCLVVILVSVLDPHLLQRINLITTTTITTNSLLSRVQLWKIAIELFRKNPLLGIGLNSFNFTQEAKSVLLVTRGVAFHNLFLQVLTEMGLFGFLTFTLFQILMLREAIVRYYSSRDYLTKTLCIGFLGIYISLLFMSVFDNLFSPLIQWPVWAYFGLICTLFTKNHKR
jgi:O-antigen ligase